MERESALSPCHIGAGRGRVRFLVIGPLSLAANAVVPALLGLFGLPAGPSKSTGRPRAGYLHGYFPARPVCPKEV